MPHKKSAILWATARLTGNFSAMLGVNNLSGLVVHELSGLDLPQEGRATGATGATGAGEICRLRHKDRLADAV